MIKFLIKSVIVVLLLLLLIPLVRFLINLVSNMLSDVGVMTTAAIDPWALAAFAFIGLTIFFIYLIFK